jgi:hypothetical protein
MELPLKKPPKPTQKRPPRPEAPRSTDPGEEEFWKMADE